MRPPARRMWLIAALAVVVLLARLAPADDKDSIGHAAPVSVASSASTPASASPMVLQVTRVVMRASEDHDHASHWPLFSSPAAAAPVLQPPARQAPLAPPAPAAVAAPPVLPYALLGRWNEGAQRMVLLQDGERTLIVGQGDVLGSDYRVEQVKGSSMILRQLSSGTQLALELGEALGEDD